MGQDWDTSRDEEGWQRTLSRAGAGPGIVALPQDRTRTGLGQDLGRTRAGLGQD